MIDYKIIEVPDDKWLSRLRKGNVVAKAKEPGVFCAVEWEYEDPEPGRFCGRIGLRTFANNYFIREESWFIQPNGCGIDGSQCLLPVMGNVPDEPREYQPADVRRFNRELERLREQIMDLSDEIYELKFGIPRIRRGRKIVVTTAEVVPYDREIDTSAVDANRKKN